MHELKAEFNRLFKIAGWSQTDAAKRLGKTPGAINHLLNPHHPNKPTQTTLRLLKMIITRERLDLVNTRIVESQGVVNNAPASNAQFSVKERDLIRQLRKLSGKEQGKVYAIIRTVLLLVRGRKNTQEEVR